MAQILDGKLLANIIKNDLKQQISTMEQKPCIAVVQVGENPASTVYISQKEKACIEVGMQFRKVALPEQITQADMLAQIEQLNTDNAVHGFIVQFPLPNHLNAQQILRAVSPTKDIDCLHPLNMGLVVDDNADFLPCTPAGVIKLIDHYNIEIAGKNCVIIGRSRIVSKPLGIMLLHRHATVTYCHSRTKNLSEICQTADILISAAGVARLVTADMIKQDSILVDIGINRIEPNNPNNRKICGDIVFDECEKKAAYITKVPGGVGPMTVAMLMVNTLKARLTSQ
ncbi:MAG: bifunctional 5,10-methylenetetrahydrofolate dehydrogenase/5,10-methenyltetrahydrofolate cyclohydrolase [Firmicutes bacterium]|nr:bifunctional 5,10-methylenetetrahydrofolate dehydrogenase/5,10-methenyltetrahydrofolate cyclohydrolase [Bacillota bacterium]